MFSCVLAKTGGGYWRILRTLRPCLSGLRGWSYQVFCHFAMSGILMEESYFKQDRSWERIWSPNMYLYHLYTTGHFFFFFLLTTKILLFTSLNLTQLFLSHLVCQAFLPLSFQFLFGDNLKSPLTVQPEFSLKKNLFLRFQEAGSTHHCLYPSGYTKDYSCLHLLRVKNNGSNAKNTCHVPNIYFILQAIHSGDIIISPPPPYKGGH